MQPPARPLGAGKARDRHLPIILFCAVATLAAVALVGTRAVWRRLGGGDAHSSTMTPGGCSEPRCCLENMAKKTASTLDGYRYPDEPDDGRKQKGTGLCILWHETRASCKDLRSFAGELEGDGGDEYHVSLSGCDARSIFLKTFNRTSAVHFEGDSIMRQFYMRLVCVLRGQDSCVDPALNTCSFYSFNETGGDRFDVAEEGRRGSTSEKHRGSDIILSYCFRTSPGLELPHGVEGGNVRLYVFGLFYWPEVFTFGRWVGRHGVDNLTARIKKLSAVMFVERITSKMKHPTDINPLVYGLLRNATAGSNVIVGRVPWNSNVSAHRPAGLERVDNLHWMCRWRADGSLVTGKLLDCRDREMRAVVVSFLREMLVMFSSR